MTEELTPEEIGRLRELLDKQAIRDVLAVASRGVDRVAPEVLRAAYHEESIDYHGAFVGSGPEFAALPGRNSPDNLMAHHALGQSLIDIEGTTAFAETYFLMNFERFARKRAEVRIGTMIGRYIDRLDKIDGEWRISVRKVVIDSSRESSKADQSPGAATFPAGRRWPDDEVFRISELRLPEPTAR
ncbi:nuclear transport factor 2 family protein [Nocardia sp. R6R-6]|uniref:nuclear transport factor 2 family protein n=1 Tax=Nocardia sp. R6R-6 TaxID=3459303 RepID=UPI00403DB09F